MRRVLFLFGLLIPLLVLAPHAMAQPGGQGPKVAVLYVVPEKGIPYKHTAQLTNYLARSLAKKGVSVTFGRRLHRDLGDLGMIAPTCLNDLDCLSRAGKRVGVDFVVVSRLGRQEGGGYTLQVNLADAKLAYFLNQFNESAPLLRKLPPLALQMAEEIAQTVQSAAYITMAPAAPQEQETAPEVAEATAVATGTVTEPAPAAVAQSEPTVAPTPDVAAQEGELQPEATEPTATLPAAEESAVAAEETAAAAMAGDEDEEEELPQAVIPIPPTRSATREMQPAPITTEATLDQPAGPELVDTGDRPAPAGTTLRRGTNYLAWTTMGLAVVAAGVGASFGWTALSNYRDAEAMPAEAKDYNDINSAYRKKRDDAYYYQDLANITYGAAAAVGLTGFIFYLTGVGAPEIPAVAATPVPGGALIAATLNF